MTEASALLRPEAAHARQLKHPFTDPTGLVPVGTGLITTGHSHFPADPTGLVPVVNRFDHYISGRLTAPVCSFQALLPPAQGRWGVLHANIYIILKLTRMRGRGTNLFRARKRHRTDTASSAFHLQASELQHPAASSDFARATSDKRNANSCNMRARHSAFRYEVANRLHLLFSFFEDEIE